MGSSVIRRAVILNGRKTSVSVEQPFWIELKSIAAERKVGLHRLISVVAVTRQQHNLSSALRLFGTHPAKAADAIINRALG